MKTIIKIAKAEINTLFYSPIAWFLCIVFLVQCGLGYTSRLSGYLLYQDLGPQYYNILIGMTNHIFAPRTGLFPSVIGNLYLYIPLLTMGLISREINNGTIKLLYSSPIKVRQIVAGKFLAMMVYSFLLILILACFVIAAMFNIRSADIGMLLSGLLGVYLLLCTYAAIGLFMSGLTSYQIVAALGTLVIFAVLEYVGGLWQGIDFVRDLTYFLCISGRTNNMLLGLISTKDVLYFILIIYMFLGFSIVKLQAERESKKGGTVKMKYVLIFCSALLTGYIFSLPKLTGYYDVSASKQMTLVPNSQKIIKELNDGPLEVTVYANLLDISFNNLGRPEKHNENLERWETYLRFKPDIKFKYVYYYDAPDSSQQVFKYNPGKSLKELAVTFAKGLNVDLNDFKTPEEIKKIIDLSPEHNRYVVKLQYKDRSTFLRVFDDMIVVPTEREIDAALKRLTASEFPKICFLEGEFERSKSKLGDRDYGQIASARTFRYAFVNQGFDVSSVSLQEQDIPANIAVLVIADPKTEFSPVVLAKIQKYIDAGGNLLIAAEPGKQAILNPLIGQMGVKIMDGALVQKNLDLGPDVILPFFTKSGIMISNRLEDFIKDSTTLMMPGTAGLSYINDGAYQIKPITLTNEKVSWNKKGKLTVDSADVVYSVAEGDEKKSVPTILALSRKINNREQRIIVTGDADFMSNQELAKSGVNFEFASDLFGWFTNGKYPIDTRRPPGDDNWINLTSRGMTTLNILFIWVFPGLILAVGSIFLIRRKRK
jgi:ABC-2 type transport system permease protein